MNWTLKTLLIVPLLTQRGTLRLRLGLSITLFALCGIAFGQNRFVEGYVVIPSGDTVKGFIKDQDWRVNPSSIKFRKGADGSTTTYTAAQIRLFRTVSGTYYESKAVMYDRSPVELALLSTSAEPRWEKDTLLLEVEVKGQVNLYYLVDATSKQHFFIEKAGSDLAEELLNVKYLVYQDGVKTTSFTQQYKSQLRNYMGDCQAVQGQILQTKYNLTSLRALTTKYNGCNEQRAATLAVQPDNNKTSVAFGVLAGVHRTRMVFKSDNPAHRSLTNGFYENNINGTGGISVNVIFPRGRQRLSLYGELLYLHYNLSKVVEQTRATGAGTSYRKEASGFDVSYGRVNLLLRYHWATGTWIRPYLQSGVSGAHSLRNSNYYELTTREVYDLAGTVYSNYAEGVILQPPKKIEFGWLAGVGVTAGRFGLEGRYEIGDGLVSSGGPLSSTRKSAYLLLSYAFRKSER